MVSQQVYKSKYTWWIVAVMAIIILLTPTLMVLWGFNWYLLGASIVIAAFILDMMMRTSYTIKGDKLHLRAGCIFHLTLDIQKITSIKHRTTCVNDSSFAWSINRLIIETSRGFRCQVSPTDEQNFIKSLLETNPNIKLK